MQIEAKNGGNQLIFLVTNSLPYDMPQSEGGIGLENIKRRLELLYPGKHELIINKEKEKFT
ncbi:hypothetical protein, partial [Rhizobium leguminosarum]|uniref:hypothetical protein n=1 Tax=Rhizobium leguminosarum TaxID=384 RepID=UPI003F98EC1D